MHEPDAWTKDPEAVAQAERMPWPKFIRLTEPFDFDQLLTMLPNTKVRWSSLTLSEVGNGFWVDDEEYKRLKQAYPKQLVLLGCDNGH